MCLDELPAAAGVLLPYAWGLMLGCIAPGAAALSVEEDGLSSTILA